MAEASHSGPLGEDPPPQEPERSVTDDDQCFIDPELEQQYTVILFSLDACGADSSPKTGTAIVYIHAADPDSAERDAIKAVSAKVRNNLWNFARAIFITEGHHIDTRSEIITV